MPPPCPEFFHFTNSRSLLWSRLDKTRPSIKKRTPDRARIRAMATTTILTVLPRRFLRNWSQWDRMRAHYRPRKSRYIPTLARRPSASPMLVGRSENTADGSDDHIEPSAWWILTKQEPIRPYVTPASPQKVSFHSDSGETTVGLTHVGRTEREYSRWQRRPY
jgi:hypothetical protein